MTRRSEIILKVFLWADKNGERWEFIKTDGTTAAFRPLSDRMLRFKIFKNPEAAVQFAKSEGYERFQVIRQDPPIPPNCEWKQIILENVS